MSKFDYYEIVGVLAPGVALLVGSALIFPEIASWIEKENFSLGDFGIVVIVAFILGHLVQAVGNFLENIYWKFRGGRPTDWVRTKKHHLLSDGQIRDLNARLKITLEEERVGSIHDLKDYAWASIGTEMAERIKAKGLDARSYLFNGNYGLMRGIAAAFLLIMIALVVTKTGTWQVFAFVAFGFVLALYRMERFGKYYAKALFTAYLNIEKGEKKKDDE